MILSALITSNQGYYAVWTCAKILSTYSEKNMGSLLEDYPVCESFASGSNPDQVAPVLASFAGNSSGGVGAALNLSFGMALWLALNIHAIGIEVYVRSLLCLRLEASANKNSCILPQERRNDLGRSAMLDSLKQGCAILGLPVLLRID